MERIYFLTVAGVKCFCGHTFNVRTKQNVTIMEPCWKCCKYSLKVVLGYGERNYRFALIELSTNKETTVVPSYVTQKRPEAS